MRLSVWGRVQSILDCSACASAHEHSKLIAARAAAVAIGPLLWLFVLRALINMKFMQQKKRQRVRIMFLVPLQLRQEL